MRSCRAVAAALAARGSRAALAPVTAARLAPDAAQAGVPPPIVYRVTQFDRADGPGAEPSSRFFSKPELARLSKVHTRDLRNLDSSFRNQLPAVLARRHAVVVHIPPVRALITADALQIFEGRLPRELAEGVLRAAKRKAGGLPYADPGDGLARELAASKGSAHKRSKSLDVLKTRVRTFLQEHGWGETPLDGGLQVLYECHTADIGGSSGALQAEGADATGDGGGSATSATDVTLAQLPAFELVALEAVLSAAALHYQDKFRKLNPEVHMQLANLDSKRDVFGSMQRLLLSRKELSSLELQVREARNALAEVMKSDEDMAGMQLSMRDNLEAQGKQLDDDDHQVVEELLEEYYRQLEDVLNEVKSLRGSIKMHQETAAANVDLNRNELIRVNIYMSQLTLGAACASVVVGALGMNCPLPIGLDSDPAAFSTMLYVACGAAAFSAAVPMAWMRRLKL